MSALTTDLLCTMYCQQPVQNILHSRILTLRGALRGVGVYVNLDSKW